MEKSLVLRPEHVPLKSIYHTVAQIDLPRWAQSVAQKGVVHELPIYFDGQFTVRDSVIRCFGVQQLLPKQHIAYPHLEHNTFAIVRLSVRVEGNGVRLLNPKESSNHSVAVYCHRSSTKAPWIITVCDPNWRDTTIGNRYKNDLFVIAHRLLNSLRVSQQHAEIELRRCLNVNVCSRKESEKGVCYTGICADLKATELLVNIKGYNKARDGNELMDYISLATYAVRPHARQFLDLYHDPHHTELQLHDLMKHSLEEVERHNAAVIEKQNDVASDVFSKELMGEEFVPTDYSHVRERSASPVARRKLQRMTGATKRKVSITTRASPIITRSRHPNVFLRNFVEPPPKKRLRLTLKSKGD